MKYRGTIITTFEVECDAQLTEINFAGLGEEARTIIDLLVTQAEEKLSDAEKDKVADGLEKALVSIKIERVESNPDGY